MFANTLCGLLLLSFAKTSWQILVEGTPGGVDWISGFRPFRLEINSFQHAGPAFDLYIQALQEMMDEDQNELFSYYRVAGVHGYPQRPYDHVEGIGTTPGYCQHYSVIFPPWHRPYLALFERVIWNRAQGIAAKYPEGGERAQYQDAALTLRIPYWDWSLNSTMPECATTQNLVIRTYRGVETVPNPLYSYKFHPVNTVDFPHSFVSQYNETVRSPIPGTYASSQEASNAVLQKNSVFFHDGVYSLLSSETNYQPFSNAGERPGGWNSLENIHNAVHQWVGGYGGHMMYLPYGSFDPLFWLHHANVDRLFAIWQALNPDSYVVPQLNQLGTYIILPQATEDVDTPLFPFHSNTYGGWHTAATVRSTKIFGYTYPELIDWAMDSAQFAQNVRKTVNFLYHPSTTTKRASDNARVGAALAADYQWVLNVRVKRSQLPDSLGIHFFNSAPPPSPWTWSTAQSLVGTHPVMIPGQSSPGTISVGSIQLTHYLLGLPSLKEKPILKYLTGNLHWSAQFQNGSQYDDMRVMKDAVEVELLVRSVEQTEGDDEFPNYGDWKGFGIVSLGRRGKKVF